MVAPSLDGTPGTESVFAPKPVSVAAAQAAAYRFGNSATKEVVWRAQPDGTLQVARRRRARVELYSVAADGTPELLEISRRSGRATAEYIGAYGGFAVGFATFLVRGGDAWGAGTAFLFVVAGWTLASRIGPGSLVRAWLRERFGTDADWVTVPGNAILGATDTGNQLVAIAGLADARGEEAVYRNLPDGTVEAATKGHHSIEIHAVDHRGGVALVDTLEARSLRKVSKLRGERAEWHRLTTKVDDGD